VNSIWLPSQNVFLTEAEQGLAKLASLNRMFSWQESGKHSDAFFMFGGLQNQFDFIKCLSETKLGIFSNGISKARRWVY
ncbi:hypothetical protein, partial [Leptospira biflexa]|uniref:hypothetical protein n=1 Tax=Leptospira biflexa TaxID=172 RepID=UPI001AEFC327